MWKRFTEKNKQTVDCMELECSVGTIMGNAGFAPMVFGLYQPAENDKDPSGILMEAAVSYYNPADELRVRAMPGGPMIRRPVCLNYHVYLDDMLSTEPATPFFTVKW